MINIFTNQYNIGNYYFIFYGNGGEISFGDAHISFYKIHTRKVISKSNIDSEAVICKQQIKINNCMS